MMREQVISVLKDKPEGEMVVFDETTHGGITFQTIAFMFRGKLYGWQKPEITVADRARMADYLERLKQEAT